MPMAALSRSTLYEALVSGKSQPTSVPLILIICAAAGGRVSDTLTHPNPC